MTAPAVPPLLSKHNVGPLGISTNLSMCCTREISLDHWVQRLFLDVGPRDPASAPRTARRRPSPASKRSVEDSGPWGITSAPHTSFNFCQFGSSISAKQNSTEATPFVQPETWAWCQDRPPRSRNASPARTPLQEPPKIRFLPSSSQHFASLFSHSLGVFSLNCGGVWTGGDIHVWPLWGHLLAADRPPEDIQWCDVPGGKTTFYRQVEARDAKTVFFQQ